jgi:hypothetical protein
MSNQMSRDSFDSMTASEQNEFIKNGGTLYDGKRPPEPPRMEKSEYLISRRLYDSLTVGQEQELNRKYAVVIID